MASKTPGVWIDYCMWYRSVNAVANGGCSQGWLGEWRATNTTFRARSQAEAQKKADKFITPASTDQRRKVNSNVS